MLQWIVSFNKTIFVIDSQCVNKQSEYFAYHQDRLFPTELPSHWPINMVKVLLFSFQQCFVPFTMLLVEGSSETRFVKHLSNHVFQSPSVQKSISYQGHLFSDNVQDWVKISKMQEKKKNREKVLCFWDNCIWRYCNKLSLLRREYLSSAGSLLRNSRNIFHITKTDFFWLNCCQND